MYLVKSLKKFFIERKLNKNNNKYENYGSISLQSDIINSILKEGARVASLASVRKSVIGDLSSVGRNSKITHTEVGKYCAISWDVTINAINHPMTHLSISAFPYVPHVGNFVKKRAQEYEYVSVGNDVWIGAHSVIMPGITIGDGAIIAAGAIVTKNVPDYAVVAGVPAKILKYRFDKNLIKELQNIKWWDFNKSVIKENIHLFQESINMNTIKRLKEIS